MEIDLTKFSLLVDSQNQPLMDGDNIYLQDKIDASIIPVAWCEEIIKFYGCVNPLEKKELTELSSDEPPSSQPSCSSQKIKNWNRNAILILISLRKKYNKQFEGTTMKADKCWKLVADDLEKNGISATVSQCRDKFKYLKDRYTKKKDNMSAKSTGAEHLKFEFFEEMDDLLGKKALINPVALASSIKIDPSDVENIDETTANNETTEDEAKPKKKKFRKNSLNSVMDELKKIHEEKEKSKESRHKELLEQKQAIALIFENSMKEFVKALKEKK